MDSYSSALERTRVPQPSLQKLAVISLFEKLRSAPTHSDADSDAGREAITQCLHSKSPAVVDQSVREICRLVRDSKLELSRGLLELQSALEGSEDARFVNVFVKGLGFIVRLGFQKHSSEFRFCSPESHPFVKVLSCRAEVQSELPQQVLLFIVQNKRLGMEEVCGFLRPLLTFSISRVPFSASLSSFSRSLVSSMASLCCSYPAEAMPVIKLLMGCLKHFPCKNAEDFREFSLIVECTVGAYIAILRHLVAIKLLVSEAQICGVELLQTILSSCLDLHKHLNWDEALFEISKRLLFAQKELGLSYISELSSAVIVLFVPLIQSELEHEQLSILKLLLLLLKWKSENEHVLRKAACGLTEELLFIFPVISLMSSPSSSVKQAATDLLFMLEKLLINLLVDPKTEPIKQRRFPSISRPEHIIFRLLEHLWFQDPTSLSSYVYLNFASTGETNAKEMKNVSKKTWASMLRVYISWIVERKKSSLPISQSQEIFRTEMPVLLTSIASVLITHQKLGSSPLDLLAVSGTMDPKLDISLLLVIMFYNSVFSGKDRDINFHDMLLKLLGMLPSLASHPVMTPLIVQTILPMLHKDTKPVLYATAVRLLCKTWEINDRVFGSLQGVLLPTGFTKFMAERNICISMALSVQDVCRKNPDRGVDLILSVSACIESQDPIIQALGFQSLAHLCEADVIDFYTAWDVIEKYVTDSLENPTVAYCVCLLLRWGAMDAEAYPEAAFKVLQVLWEVGTSNHLNHDSLWAKSRASALEALSHYEVSHIQKSIAQFKEKNMELLICETDPKVLFSMERLELKIISYEHMTRRRLVKEKKISGNKIEKLIEVFPQVIFSSGNSGRATELPGAALFCFSLIPKDVNDRRASKGIQDIHATYEKALVEIAGSLPLSRNILIALISLQSWKPFMQRWVKAQITFFDVKGGSSTVLDKTSKVTTDILKRMIRIAEESIPRCAENVGLAVGALCRVLPPSAHAVKSTASKFLLNWLFQYDHEYRQWTAAISLGFITSCLHLTDHKQKSENINALIEVASSAKSILVKGACGVGLGISCQDLLSMVQSAPDSDLDKETYKKQEADLLGKIVRVLCQMIQQFTPSSSGLLPSISAYFPPGADDIDSDITSELGASCDDLEEDIWGVAGLVIGLGSSVGAIYRAGANDAVLQIKDLIISWVPHANPSIQNSFGSKNCAMVLSIGGCLALPIIVGFCQRVELMDGTELDRLVGAYRELISELVSIQKSGNFHQSLLFASCTGAGSLLACILNEGVHSMEVEQVKNLLALFKRTYYDPHPPLINLGGMLGAVNALGAGAGTLVYDYPLASLRTVYDQKESSYIMGPILSSRVLEPHVTSLVQELFLIAQNSDDHQLQQSAAWAVSLLRHRLCARQIPNVDGTLQVEAVGSKSASHNFPEDSVVMKLSTWLMHLNYTGETGTIPHVNTVATALRCLSQAPRLPMLDWGVIIRRCMRYECRVAEWLPPDSALKKGILREECLKFCLAHAIQFDPLLSFLDELSDLPRFRMLELNLQSCLLLHTAELIKVFSGSRVQKLFDDLANYFSGLDQVDDPEQKSLLRVSCWKGLFLCLDEASLDSQEYISSVEYCMKVLFSSLPDSRSAGADQISVEEWSEAVRCLGKARLGWLLDLLQVSEVHMTEGDARFVGAVKRIQAKARLVCTGSIPVSELGKLRAHILNKRSDAVWDVLVEVVAALQHAEGSVRRQWLVDALEIGCVTNYPSTALRFIGLLCGSCSKYMPLLIVDPMTVLSDLPVNLASLLSETSWGLVSESVISSLWTLTERIYGWATHIERGDDSPSSQPISESENDMAVLLLQVVHHACVCMRDHLPHDKQLRLVNMVVP